MFPQIQNVQVAGLRFSTRRDVHLCPLIKKNAHFTSEPGHMVPFLCTGVYFCNCYCVFPGSSTLGTNSSLYYVVNILNIARFIPIGVFCYASVYQGTRIFSWRAIDEGAIFDRLQFQKLGGYKPIQEPF